MNDDPHPRDARDARTTPQGRGSLRSPDEAPRRRRSSDPRRTVLLVVAAVIVVGAVIFWAQNHGRVSISYLTVDITAPLWLMVTGYFLVGILIGVLLTVYYQRRQP
jgi:uncharacterized integral membrane protein